MSNKTTYKRWIIFFLIISVSCTTMADGEEDKAWEERITKQHNPYYFYRALYTNDAELVKRFLEAGTDPNYCRGENGWVDSNPLKVLAESFYNTYDYGYGSRPKVVPDPVPDVEIFWLLLNAGADINKLPYIWDRVFIYSNQSLDRKRQRIIRDIASGNAALEEEKRTFIKDANRLLEAFLKAGADPDKLGHPYPFGYDWKVPFLTDKKANKYFSKGTRAINIAIEKGIVWESQVDLLLQYTTLDEESLKAAERSGDPAMVEKINALWKKQ
jgi:hypothetical protein